MMTCFWTNLAAYGSPLLRRRLRSDNTVLLPHCTKAAVVGGEVVRQNFDTTEVAITTNVHINLGLSETACFHVQLEQNSSIANSSSFMYNGSLLYTVEYTGLQQTHPVRQQYTFGIPELHSKCICDCPGGENHCAIGYKYKNCTNKAEGICVTTYHAHQSTAGCPYGEEAELCCEVSASPFNNWKYAAVYLGQPDTVAQLRYRLFRSEKMGWIAIDDHTVKVPLNTQHRIELNDDKLELEVNALKPHYQLKEAMYFYKVNSGDASLRTGVPLNELYEWNMGKLGWFRYQDGQWSLRNGFVKLQDAHHAQVENCKAQTYTENYNAEYFVTSSKDDVIYLGSTVEETEHWVAQTLVTPDQRRILIVHAESPPVSLDLTMNNKVKLRFLHHSSELRDFEGRIQLDKFSNKYLNITYQDAMGTLIGAVYKNEAKREADIAFSGYVDSSEPTNSSTVIMLPSTVNSSRWVCIHPLDRADSELCRWLSYQAQPLDWFEVPFVWTHNQGECQGCNEISFNSFLQYLNPAKWFDGISSTAEALALGVEVVFYVVFIIVVITVCKRCVCPLMRWSLCEGWSSSRKSVKSESS